jgi:hypothetical protein
MGWRWYWKSWEKCEGLVHSSWRLTQSILLIGTLLPLLLVIWKLHGAPPPVARTVPAVSPVVRLNDGPAVSVADTAIALRPLLPFSVIPGGAHDPAELRSAIAHDPVVAMHYALFDMSKARVIRLDHDEAMYVSYRMGEHVFWTRKKLMLPKGEALLTDGQHLARTRCGNRLSPTSEMPTSLREPERAALETPAAPELAGIMTPLADLPLSPIGPLTIPPPEAAAGGHFFIPPIIPIFWVPPGTPGVPATPGKPGTPPPPPPPPPPIVGIPEPSTLLLLCTGMSVLGFAVRRKHTTDTAE